MHLKMAVIVACHLSIVVRTVTYQWITIRKSSKLSVCQRTSCNTRIYPSTQFLSIIHLYLHHNNQCLPCTTYHNLHQNINNPDRRRISRTIISSHRTTAITLPLNKLYIQHRHHNQLRRSLVSPIIMVNPKYLTANKDRFGRFLSRR